MGLSEIELQHQTGFISSEDGTRLFWQGLQPAGGHLAAVALVHGYDSASDYLLPMMECLAGRGLACYAIDARGHGRSEGVPRHVFHFNEYLGDARALCRHVAESAGERQAFLFGYSLGGLIVALLGLGRAEQFHGAVLSAPFFGPAFRVPRVLDLCAQAASAVCPTLCLPRRHPDQPAQMTLRWWTETLAAQRFLRRQAELFTLPVLMLHGGRDSAACPRAARSLFRRLGSRDKTLRILPEARHHDLDPCQGPAWWGEVRDWIASRAQDHVFALADRW